MKTTFSTTWKRSTQPRKQRKYKYNAPLHIKQNQVRVHLSPELRKKHNFRNLPVRKGDKIKVLRGKYAKKDYKVDRVNLKLEKIYLEGIEAIKKDGTKHPFPFKASNLMIIDLSLSDKKRKMKLEEKKNEDEKKAKKGNIPPFKTTDHPPQEKSTDKEKDKDKNKENQENKT